MIDLRGTFFNKLDVELPDNPSESHHAYVQENIKKRIKYRELEKEFLSELEAVGVLADTLSDFTHTSLSYSPAIPVLYKYLSIKTNNKRYTEGLMRALTVKEAKGVGVEPFVREFIWGATNISPFTNKNYNNHMFAAINAMKEVAVKGESEKIKTCFPYLEAANIHPKDKEDFRKRLTIAFKRGGGKLPIS